MRLFIAINFNNDTMKQLISIREELRSRSIQGNFPSDENLHLTLAFLGECDNEQKQKAKDAMNAVNFNPFEISIEKIGRFKRNNFRGKGGDIWWAGIREDDALMKLQRELSENLRKEGFETEERRYSPHITIGREIVTDQKIKGTEPFGETVHSIELMKSERVDNILTYTSIYEKRGGRQ